MAKPFYLLLYVGLSAGIDVLVCTFESCYATQPDLPRPTTVTGSDGQPSFLIPFVWPDLADLTSTTTVTTSITETDDTGALITPSVPIIVQPQGYWYVL